MIAYPTYGADSQPNAFLPVHYPRPAGSPYKHRIIAIETKNTAMHIYTSGTSRRNPKLGDLSPIYLLQCLPRVLSPYIGIPSFRVEKLV